MSDQDEFEEHRRVLEGIAYRMCGVLADDQDSMQDTHLKWCSTERSSIRDPKACFQEPLRSLLLTFFRRS